jgi:hypothetical protein
MKHCRLLQKPVPQTASDSAPELEASSEATEDSVTAANGKSNVVVPPKPENRSWWQRIFTN